MRLNDPLVTSFIYDNEEYDIDLSFDTVLDVYDVLDMKHLRDYEKARMCLSLLLDDQEYDRSETINLWNHIYLNYIHVESKEMANKDLPGSPVPKPKEEKERVIGLDQDANYRYASFMQAYGINLIEQQGKMHWKQFLELLDGLPSNTRMKEIIKIRTWKPSKHDSSEYKEQMKELQEDRKSTRLNSSHVAISYAVF